MNTTAIISRRSLFTLICSPLFGHPRDAWAALIVQEGWDYAKTPIHHSDGDALSLILSPDPGKTDGGWSRASVKRVFRERDNDKFRLLRWFLETRIHFRVTFTLPPFENSQSDITRLRSTWRI
ncbi:hypothetical protein TNCV_1458541 [Trichonephila clavipes]|nr:hypothetical protein TNCV_1458541 [Trichonephila clavipes]